ncbi:MAG TPA: Na+/H+ antiporter subunit E [Pyrinomonadaceae bacterium]|nr:Na+/H+ antiporter subunit E [Pyrinomonadaceae bacterium]
MNPFLLNILLALAWEAMNGEFTFENFAVGFALGFVILFFAQRVTGETVYARRVWRVLGLLVFFVKELIIANVRVAYDVLTPGYQMRPGVLAVPLDAETDEEIMLLASLTSLTPGTLNLDVSADRRTLYIHAMYADDPAAVKRSIKEGFERRVLGVLR